MKEKKSLFVGIDLGTTNSAVATVKISPKGKITTPLTKIDRYEKYMGNSPIKGRGELLPSVVYYPANAEPMVGDIGVKQRLTQPYAVVSSVKSQMGEKSLKEVSDNIIDKTPEEVSARILKLIIASVKKTAGVSEVKNVVITVPANFSFEKRQATMKAAELAGIEVRKDKNGMYNDDELLLSEPKAVMYDFINEMNNDSIDERVDFSTPKNMLVFDIGGGTLDITLHKVTMIGDNDYKIEDIATNRFSNIAGDTFDAKLVDEIFNKFHEYYNISSQEAGEKILKEKEKLKREITPYAKELKEHISNLYDDREADDDSETSGSIIDEDEEFDIGGGHMSNGYILDVYLTLSDFENCLKPLMGDQFSFEDYKKFESIDESKNIIYPVLDVLYKAYKKEGTDVKVDGVILNGGMSRLYLIQKRLEKFFGFKPIMVTDPDKSVAQGAAVYHYNLHQKNNVFKSFGFDDMQADDTYEKKVAQSIRIESSGDVMPDTLYLGLTGGINEELVEAGQELPFEIKKKGFGIEKGAKWIDIPIRMKKNKNEYTTVATSRIMFQNTYDSDKNVTVKFSVNRSQILTFEAWISHDKEGNNIIESGTVELKIGEANIAKKSKTKLLPQAGAKVPVENTVAQLKNLCCNGLKNTYKIKNRDRSKKMRIQIYEQIRKQKKLIETCGNPRDFAEPLLSGLRDELNTEFRHAVIPVARKISKHWTEIERKELARICERILKASIQDQLVIGNDSNTSVNGEAIITLGVVGDEKQISILPEFESNTKYRHSLLCAYGSAGIRADWILKKFNDDADHHNKQIQESVKALGAVIRNGGRFNAKEREETVDRLIQFIESFPENKSNLVLALISLGYCCNIEDRQEVLDKAAEAIDDMPNYYSYMSDVLSYAKQAISIAKRLINKEEISSEDEEYLLFKFDSDSEI